MGELSPTHWLIVIVVALVLFGGKKLPEVARGLGRSARILKAELSGSAENHAESQNPPERDSRPEAGRPDQGRTTTG
jgi:sec-independent protein translocase protein TatA